MSQISKPPPHSLDDLIDEYMEKHRLSLRKITTLAAAITDDQVSIPYTSLSNWKSGASKSIKNWDQALVLAFIFQLDLKQTNHFFVCARVHSLAVSRRKKGYQELIQKFDVYANEHGQYGLVLQSWGVREAPETFPESKSTADTHPLVEPSSDVNEIATVLLLREQRKLRKRQQRREVAQLVMSSRIMWSILIGISTLLFITWFRNSRPQFMPTKAIQAHETKIQRVAWSPEGDLIATAGDDGAVKLWDTETLTLTRTFLDNLDSIRALEWCSDGGRIASGDDAHYVFIWNIHADVNIPPLRIQENGVVRGLAWSHQCDRIATGTERDYLHTWDAVTGEKLLHFRGHSGWVRGTAWSPDDSRIASASADKTTYIWDAETTKQIAVLKDASSNIQWQPNGEMVAVSFDTDVLLWDFKTRTPNIRFSHHRDGVQDIDWHPSGNIWLLQVQIELSKYGRLIRVN